MSRSISRRSFLGAAAATVAAPMASPAMGFAAPQARTTPGRPGLRIGVASYSLRKFPLDQALTICRSLGVRYLTLKDVHLARTDPAAAVTAHRQEIEAAGHVALEYEIDENDPAPGMRESLAYLNGVAAGLRAS